MTSSRFSTIITVCFAIALLLGVNMVARYALSDAALDFTQDGIYSLSDGTDEIIASIDEPLTVRLFFASDQANGLPVFRAYSERIRNMLERFARLSDGTITFTELNPAPFTEEEDLAVTHGIQGIPTDAAGNKFYFGMSVENSIDERKTIAFFDPSRGRFLEYDIVKLLHETAQPKQKKLGLLSTLPIRGRNSSINMARQGPWAVLEKMEERFDVDIIPQTVTAIDPAIDTLMVVHPHGFSNATLYAIDQFLLRGGNLLLFLDARVQLPDTEVRQSALPRLLDHWGVEFSSDRLVAEKDSALNISQENANSRLRAFPNVTWLELDESYLSDASVVTTDLDTLRVVESGYFTRDEAKEGLEYTPLITTQPAAMSVAADKLDNGGDLLELYQNYVPSGTPFTLAAQLSGNFTSAFEGKRVATENEDHIATAAQAGNIILVGDADILRDELWVDRQDFMGQSLAVPNADNGAFVLNAIEFLSGDNALIGLRSKGSQVRRFDVLDRLREQAELTFREKESRLQTEMKAMEQQLRDLQSEQSSSGNLFTAEQQREINSFRETFTNTRKELRAVQRELNHDIQSLGQHIALINILLVPGILLLCAFVVPGWLRRRHQHIAQKEARA